MNASSQSSVPVPESAKRTARPAVAIGGFVVLPCKRGGRLPDGIGRWANAMGEVRLVELALGSES